MGNGVSVQLRLRRNDFHSLQIAVPTYFLSWSFWSRKVFVAVRSEVPVAYVGRRVLSELVDRYGNEKDATKAMNGYLISALRTYYNAWGNEKLEPETL